MRVTTAKGGGLVRRVTYTLTDAQIKALPTTNLQLAPAPGVGFCIVPLSVLVTVNALAGAYTNLNAALAIFPRVGGGSNGDWLGFMANSGGDVNQRASSLLGTVGKRVVLFAPNVRLPLTNQPSVSDLVGTENAAFTLGVNNNGGAGNFTGGNAANRMVVTADYVVVPVA